MPGTVPTGIPIAGTEGRFQVNNLNLNLDGWDVTLEAADLPSENFESNGFREGIFGFLGGEVSAEGFWDAGLAPHANPPNLVAGTDLVNVKLFVRRTGNRAYNFPSFRLLSVRVNNRADGMVRVSIRGRSNGTFTYAQ
jgi:hypothetical protein